MKHVWLSLLVALAAPARAGEVDMNTQTCQDWLDASEDEQELMSAWLKGYGAGRASSGLYDVARTRADALQLRGYCQAHPNIGLLSASGEGKR